MANITPAIDSFGSSVDIYWTSAGAVNVNPGDRMLFSDMAAALAVAGYNWTRAYQVFSRTYTTAKDARNYILYYLNPSDVTMEADGITFGPNYLGGFQPFFYLGVTCGATIVRVGQRAVTFKIEAPLSAPGVVATYDAFTTTSTLGAILPSSCQLKPLLTTLQTSMDATMDAFGAAGLAFWPSYGTVPNVMPYMEDFQGFIYPELNISTWNSGSLYRYLTIDMGWSAAR